jgi:O-antigen ligase
MALLQAAIAGLIALIIVPGYLFYFDVTPKLTVLLAGTAVALLLLKPARSWFGALLAAGAASLALSAVYSTNPALSWFGSNWRRFGASEQVAVLLFAWLVATQISSRPESLRTILRAIAAAGLLAGIYGILQYSGVDPLLPAAAYHIGEGIWTIVRPPGTLGYVSYFANWLVMAAFLSLALAQLETNKWLRIAAYLAAAVCGFSMLLTGTRGAMLAAAAGCAVLLFTRAIPFTRRAAVICGIAALALVAFYYSPAGWNLHSRARWFVEDPRGGARLQLWRDSLAMSSHRLTTGYGPEVFTAQFPYYESKRLAEAYPDFAHESPHNMFLDVLVAQGLPGLLALAGICAFGLMRARSKWLAAAIVAGIVAQQFTAFTIPTAVLFFMTIALAVGQAGSLRRIGNPPPAVLRIPLFALRIATAGALLYLAFRFTAADRYLELTRRAIAAGNGQSATFLYGQSERWRLPGSSSDLWYSTAMSALAQKAPNPIVRIRTAAQAGYAALNATRTAEDPFNAWYHAAALYASTNDAFFAERSLRAAIAAHPNWFKPHWMLARVLRIEGRLDDARGEAVVAMELDGGKHKEVADTLRNSLSAPPKDLQIQISQK